MVPSLLKPTLLLRITPRAQLVPRVSAKQTRWSSLSQRPGSDRYEELRDFDDTSANVYIESIFPGQ